MNAKPTAQEQIWAHLKQRIRTHGTGTKPGPKAHPQLFGPLGQSDRGVRSQSPYAPALYNPAIITRRADDSANDWPPVVGVAYKLALQVRNSGGFGAFPAIVEFYVVPRGHLSAAQHDVTINVTSKSVGGTSLGRVQLNVPSGATVEALSDKPWTPADAEAAASSLYAVVFDIVLDRVPFANRLDAERDRHVVRRDQPILIAGEFAGKLDDVRKLPRPVERMAPLQTGITIEDGDPASPGKIPVAIFIKGQAPMHAFGTLKDDTLTFTQDAAGQDISAWTMTRTSRTSLDVKVGDGRAGTLSTLPAAP